MSLQNLTQYFERLLAALDRCRIKDPEQMVNTDQSGVTFTKMKGKSLRKWTGAKHANLLQKALTTIINLDWVTLISIVMENGVAYKPAPDFPGTFAG